MSCRTHATRFFRSALLLLLLVVACLSMLQGAHAVEEDHPLLNDPEVLQAMELFMGMSATEREETIRGLMEAVGDDPAKRAEMEFIISKLPAVEREQIKNSPGGRTSSTLKQMVHDDEVAKAKQNARRQLDGTTWETFWENQEAILEATIQGGQLSPEDAARFKTDEKAWEEQLRVIFEDLGKREL